MLLVQQEQLRTQGDVVAVVDGDFLMVFWEWDGANWPIWNIDQNT
jgi:hypothetical protein